MVQNIKFLKVLSKSIKYHIITSKGKMDAQRASLVIGSNGNTSNSKIYGNRVGDKSHNQPQKYLCKFYYPEACQDPTSHLQYKCHTTDKALIVLIDA